MRSRLDEGRSPRAAEGLESVGVGIGLAVFMVQASPKPPSAETPTPPVQVGSFLVVPPTAPFVMGWPKADCEPDCSRSWLPSNMETVAPLDDQVHSFWDQSAMLSVALPAALVATGAMVTGADAAVLLSVPQSWALPVVRLTFWIE